MDMNIQSRSTAMTNVVLEVVKEALPKLHPGVDYTSEKIVPRSLWQSFDDGTRRAFGAALSHVVKHGLVPLERTSPPYKMPVTYRRI